MSFLNQLCVDQSCLHRGSCCHMGPRGEHCYFYAEQRLCQILGKPWAPWITLDELLTNVRNLLDAKGDSSKVDEYTAAIQKAKEEVKSNVPVLSAFEKEESESAL